MKKILVVNPGSSSLKWSLYSKNKLELIASGICERIHLDGRIITKFKEQKFVDELDLPDHTIAVRELIELWKKYNIIQDLNELIAIGFRTPFSGKKYLSPVIYNDDVKKAIEHAAKFIPLHSPATLTTVDAFEKNIPKVTKIIAQDTAFHTTIPKINSTFAINQEWAKKYDIFKFGYHGLSHDYITFKMKKILGKKNVNIIIAHLGSGSSICAVKDSKSLDVSVGFSSLDGLIMGTRSGNIDPGIPDYLIRIEGCSPQDVFEMMVKKSGLLGVSGVSNDVRDLHQAQANGNKDAAFAIDLFVSKVVDYIASYINKIQKPIDGIVFTAGIGENDEIIRQKVSAQLQATFGIKISQKANLESYSDYKLISSKSSKIPVYKIKTNEELVIARYVKELIK
ncbi:acetate/propionate family kinase [Mycoplasma miroungirhinis]|uniref:Acetate kinase n=1 Tax=Mycoplasma miroungirhinis TaxID=754516 RepID=A0A6M4JB58_9MOLU|nr:acetate/propionate family kinase [Mycoplasma miroungirhinis]QJR44224.1 acetate/propionate family kinase [Mycoplasma miroungirhinis]